MEQNQTQSPAPAGSIPPIEIRERIEFAPQELENELEVHFLASRADRSARRNQILENENRILGSSSQPGNFERYASAVDRLVSMYRNEFNLQRDFSQDRALRIVNWYRGTVLRIPTVTAPDPRLTFTVPSDPLVYSNALIDTARMMSNSWLRSNPNGPVNSVTTDAIEDADDEDEDEIPQAEEIIHPSYTVEELRKMEAFSNYNQAPLDVLLNFYMNEYGSTSIDNLSYIRDLAQQTREDISRWDILELFCNPADGTIEKSRTEINAIFFAPRIPSDFVDGAKPQAVEHKKFDFKAVMGGDQTALAEALRIDVGRVEGLYSNAFRTAEELRQKVITANRALRYVEAKKENSETTVLEESLRKIEATGLFTVESYQNEGNTFIFKNTKPYSFFVDAETASMTGIDMGHEIPLGFFEVHINFHTFEVRLKCLNDFRDFFYYNTSAPYLPGSAVRPETLCWGDEAIRRDKYARDRDMLGALKMINQLMTSYNPGNPHRRAEGFYRDQQSTKAWHDSGLIKHWREKKELASITDEQKLALGNLNRGVANNPTRIVFNFSRDRFYSYGNQGTHSEAQCPICAKRAYDCICGQAKLKTKPKG